LESAPVSRNYPGGFLFADWHGRFPFPGRDAWDRYARCRLNKNGLFPKYMLFDCGGFSDKMKWFPTTELDKEHPTIFMELFGPGERDKVMKTAGAGS